MKPIPLSWFVDRITSKTPTAFSRWGDGEWYSVFGRRTGANCDGHQYFPQMGVDLKHILQARPPYVLGLQPLALRVFGGQRVQNWIAACGLDRLDWVDADVFHNASRDGKLEPLLAAVRATRLVMIGPPHLAKLNQFLGYKSFLTVPPKNCYLAWKTILHDAFAILDPSPAGTLVSISAGMPGKLLVHALHERYANRHLVIDFGSVWDVYAGVRSRRYMKGMDVAAKE